MPILREETPTYKMYESGASGLMDVDLLSLIIGGTPEKSLEKARDVLNVVGKIQKIGRCTTSDFLQIGLTRGESARVIAAIELGRRRYCSDIESRPRISSSRDAFNVIAQLLVDLDHEEFWILALNRANEVTHRKRLSIGGASGTVVDIKLVLKALIELKACAFIAVHNHPSGNLEPSRADVELTDKLKSAGKIMDLAILDHLIISERGYYSFADEGMI